VGTNLSHRFHGEASFLGDFHEVTRRRGQSAAKSWLSSVCFRRMPEFVMPSWKTPTENRDW
jgi:hypothetical protein